MVSGKPWFGPKRYFGWGWSIASWQGLVVLLLYIGSILLNLYLVSSTPVSLGVVFLLTVIFLMIVRATGTPPGGPCLPLKD